jgi:hypothetical protein
MNELSGERTWAICLVVPVVVFLGIGFGAIKLYFGMIDVIVKQDSYGYFKITFAFLVVGFSVRMMRDAIVVLHQRYRAE